MSPCVKKCGCGREHDLDGWLGLRLCGFVGKQVNGLWEAVELRHCHCGSTIGIEVVWRPA